MKLPKLLTLTTVFLLLQAIAQPIFFPNSSTAIAIKFDPPDTDAPGDREGSSSRTLCPEVDRPLTALVPHTNLGLTLTGHPTFFFYVPYEDTISRSIEFILFDQEENEIYKKEIPVKGTPGIVSFTLPETLPPLEENQQYRWQFSYICNPQFRAEDDFVEGIVMRVPQNEAILNKLNSVNNPLQKAEIYAVNKLWFDTLMTLAQLRQENPDDEVIFREWEELLESVGLGELRREAIMMN